MPNEPLRYLHQVSAAGESILMCLPSRYPDLAGYSNYLENVLKNVSTGQTYYDGINEDYNFLTTSQANASCLTESATSYQVSFLPT